MNLLDHRGNPLAPQANAVGDAESKPIVHSNGFGQWAGRDHRFATLPGGGVLQFDLSKLTLADFRSMRQHYQIGSSINVLGFILHQIDWSVEGEHTEAVTFIEEELRRVWTHLIRGMSQSFWAGYSPMAINYENGPRGRVMIESIKDLVPEECRVNWHEQEGWAPPDHVKPKILSYNGFKQNGTLINAANSMWYPLLMENGDHYGRKLLANAFPAWYFSNLMHLFSNRYYERYGEPLPIGRAPLDSEVDNGNGTTISGRQAMEGIVTNIRNRAAAVLPSDMNSEGKYEYDIEYLESQMRGADFERYMNRLDEEMSLSVFTPILLFRTADVGSYNLGQAHLRIFQQMLNAIAGDMQFYFQNYVVQPLYDLNFHGGTQCPTWRFRQQGNGDIGTYKEVMSEMIRQERAMPNLQELSSITGITWEEAQIIAKEPDPVKLDDRGTASSREARATSNDNAMLVARQAAHRTANQYAKGDRSVRMSHGARFRDALVNGNHEEAAADAMSLSTWATVNEWIDDLGDAQLSVDEMKSCIVKLVVSELASVA